MSGNPAGLASFASAPWILLSATSYAAAGRSVIVEENVRHDFHPPVAMVENDQQPHDHENHFRQLQIIFRRRRTDFSKCRAMS